MIHTTRKFFKKNLKWFATFFILLGLLLTNLNLYPYNIFSHSLGVMGWTFTGYLSKDKAIMINFGLQIPLFMIGYLKIFGF
ncbi:DUF6552 family protein [Candidatus Methylopumilus rimovensis]|uniref:DUF6552 family protein n=1 Tax=Candidatus Methylopumilus rimovensis TaxID=2588535 RepID=UPI001CB8A008|nr:DUF6552 family protein [Candidatus Methylopumilus rimovensis]